MPYVPSTNPNSLIQRPSQALLSQTYGGGSLMQPPTMNANVVPTNPQAAPQQPQTPAPAPTPQQPQQPSQGQIKGSPLSNKGGNGAADPRGIDGPEKGQVVDRQDPMNRSITKGIAAAMPGGSFITAFDKFLDLMGLDYGIVGPSTPELERERDYRQGVRDNFQNSAATVSDMESERGRGTGAGRGSLTDRARAANGGIAGGRSADGQRSQPRDTSPGRRGARDNGGGAGESGGGRADNGRGGASGTGGRDASGNRE